MDSWDRQAFINGANAWSNSPAYVALTAIDGTSYDWEATTYFSPSDPRDGYTSYTVNSFYNTFVQVYSNLNQYWTSGYSSGQVQSVAAHEEGHGLGLGHENGWTACGQPLPSLMYPGTNRYTTCGVKSPTSDDDNGIDALY